MQAARVDKPKLEELTFNTESEREIYLEKLSKKYPAGITHEVYKEEKATVNRFVIVRNNQANEFREVKYYWGGADYTLNGKPITAQYFLQQTKPRDNDYYNKKEM
ncbi:MAG: hypothetical protein HC896_13810 [Bacteroidales bacterium]|nr:hypothetical protein [Bacteroidales bacterium]